MRSQSRIYHRTKAGERALRRKDRRLAPAQRRLLAMIGPATLSRDLPARARLAPLEARRLVESVSLEWLEELYRLGCYEPTPLDSRPD